MRIELTRERIDAPGIVAAMKAGEDGAVVVFDGIVRDNTRGAKTLFLDYEAYDEMALTQMRALAEKAVAILAYAMRRSCTGWAGSRLARRAC